MAIFANDYIGIHINLFGFYEIEELNSLFDFLRPLGSLLVNGTALDIGANIGNHSCYFAARFNRVHAFEPNPITFKLLQLNSSFTGNVTSWNFGLGDTAGKFTLQVNDTNIGGASIGERLGPGAGVNVTVKTLDDLDIDFSALCFLKIDVEGYEAKVIKGGINTIKQAQPIIVLEQAANEFTDNGTTEAINLLKELRYRFCWHKIGPKANAGFLSRRLYNIMEVFIGREHAIVSGEQIPAEFHSMLIAVPPQYQQALNL